MNTTIILFDHQKEKLEIEEFVLLLSSKGTNVIQIVPTNTNTYNPGWGDNTNTLILKALIIISI